MGKDKARSMTDASEVAELMQPLIAAKIAIEVDSQILREVGTIVGEVVAGMIDNGFAFTAPIPEFVVDAVALNVGKRLLGIAVNSVQDSISYAAISVSLGVNSGVSFAILPAGAAGLSFPGGAGAIETRPYSVDLSVADAIGALLKDILTAKKPVDDIATLEFLIAKSAEKGNVEAEIFLLEQLVAKLAGGRGAITRLRRLVELALERDVKRAIGYLQQIRAIYAGKDAKNAAKNIEGVDGEIAALRGGAVEPVEVPVEPVEVPVEPVEVPVEPVDMPVEPAKATDDLDENHCQEIAAALRNLESMEPDAVVGMVRVAVGENDNDALSAFRLRLKRSANSKIVFDLLKANVAVADVLAEFGLYLEAIDHQERALELRRNFKRDFDGQVPQGPLGDRLAELVRLADQNVERVAPVPERDEGAHGNGDGDDGYRRVRGRNRDRHSGAGSDHEVVQKVAHVNYSHYVSLIREAFEAKNVQAVDSYVRQLLEPRFENIGSKSSNAASKDLRAANIRAANFFESAGEYERSVKHWEKILELQEAHPLAGDAVSQHYIGRTKANLARVRARCPQEF